MNALINNILLAAFALTAFCGAVSAAESGANRPVVITAGETGYLPGNKTLSLTFCDTQASTRPLPHYFHFNFGGPAYTAFVNGVGAPTSAPRSLDTADIGQGVSCGTFTVITSGIPNGTTTSTTPAYIIDVLSCYGTPPNSTTCPNQMGFYNLLNPANPTIALSPNSTITTLGNHTITVQLTPPIKAIAVTASCTTQHGAQVSVAPLTTGSGTSDALGRATFNINVTQLDIPLSGGTPSASCTFSVPGGAPPATVSVTGSNIDPSITISPTNIVKPGGADITVTVAGNYPNIPITANCSASAGSSNPTPSPLSSNANGKAIFHIYPANLVIADPIVANKPSMSCIFSVTGGSATRTLTFSTGNACSNLVPVSPRPAICGNPVGP